MLILGNHINSALIGWTGRKQGGSLARVCACVRRGSEEWGDVDIQFQLWKPQFVCMCVCVWEDPLLYSMALWDCCVFTLESSLIGGYEWAEGLKGDCEASGGGFSQTNEKAPGSLGRKSNTVL